MTNAPAANNRTLLSKTSLLDDKHDVTKTKPRETKAATIAVREPLNTRTAHMSELANNRRNTGQRET